MSYAERGKSYIEKNISRGIDKVAAIAGDAAEIGYAETAKKHAGGLWNGAKRMGDRWVNHGVSGKVIDATGGLITFENGNLGFSKTGKPIVIGLGALAIGYNTQSAVDERDMGTTDGTIMRATPSIRGYLQNPQQAPGGADGSLVFALHNNRRGGYL